MVAYISDLQLGGIKAGHFESPGKSLLFGGFKYFSIFTPKIGEDEPILTPIFQMNQFNHQPDYRL